MNRVNNAYQFAKHAHKGQVYNNKPFISHPVQVAKIIKLVCPMDYALQAAAYLHDILEDTEITKEELTDKFGEDVSNLVFEVTKTGYNAFPYLKSRRGIILKFADRLSNLVNVFAWDEGKQQKYLDKSVFWKS